MRTRNKQGFSLIEIMISLAITAGLLVTLLYTLNHHLSVAGRQETLTTAATLARMKIREMEKNPLSIKGFFDEPYSDYYYETAVRTSPLPSMVEISVIVRSGKETIHFAELISKRAD